MWCVFGYLCLRVSTQTAGFYRKEKKKKPKRKTLQRSGLTYCNADILVAVCGHKDARVGLGGFRIGIRERVKAKRSGRVQG